MKVFMILLSPVFILTLFLYNFYVKLLTDENGHSGVLHSKGSRQGSPQQTKANASGHKAACEQTQELTQVAHL